MRNVRPLCALLFVACSSQTFVPAPVDMAPQCNSSGDCAANKNGHVCSGGVCVVCATNADCGTGRICDTAANACVDCLTAGQCALGSKCVAKTCTAGCDKNNPCPAGEVCDPTLGACVACSSDTDCKDPANPKCDLGAHACVACTSDGDCGAGKLCLMKQCATGCSGAHPQCPSGEVCDVAHGACVSCLSDADCKDTNNPRCDVRTSQCVQCLASSDNCPVGEYCANDACQAGCKSNADCMPGTPDCDTTKHACVACTVDSSCGLGMVCASESCVAGCSQASACPGAQGCCAGACVSVLTDPSNCGNCGVKCATVANGTAGCFAGNCGIASCSAGFRDCDLVASNGCETNIAGDVKNCGACDHPCAFTHAAASCAGGSCVMGACTTGWADCDKDPTNGCETSLDTDANCGGCGTVCAPKNATGACGTGTCAVGACNAGWGDCDKNPSNGCETDLTSDANNCGACGNACGNGNICINGACGATSCAQILAANTSAKSGTFTINPPAGGTVTTYCDMSTDGGGWTMVWAHSYIEMGLTPTDAWRFYSTTQTPCQSFGTGWCNIPGKAKIGKKEMRITATHLGTIVYDYKGTLNPNLDVAWSGAIMTNVTRLTDLCTQGNGIYPEPEMDTYAYLGVTFDKWNQGVYTGNCDTDRYSGTNPDCRWENCQLPGNLSPSQPYHTQMTVTIWVR